MDDPGSGAAKVLHAGHDREAKGAPPASSAIGRLAHRSRFWFGLAVLGPALAWYVLFIFLPMVGGLVLAFLRFDPTNIGATRFVGSDNFARILADPIFGTAAWNTLALAVLQFVFVVPLSLGVSLTLVSVWRGRGLYQALFFMPFVVSLVAVSLLFYFLTDPEVGTFNQVLRAIGLPGLGWMTSSDTALPTVAGVLAWKGFGFYTVLLTAGLLAIPKEIYDLADLDGAGRVTRLRLITLPLLRNTVVLVLVLLTIGSLDTYAAVVILPGPGYSTYTLNLLLVKVALTDQRYGVAAAIALVEMAAVLIVSLAQFRLFRRQWAY
jgi:multiple sugar transport system permease protein